MSEIVDITPEDTLAAEILLQMAADHQEDTRAAELLIQMSADYLMGVTPTLEGQDDAATEDLHYDGSDEEMSDTSESPLPSPKTMSAAINAMPIYHPKRRMVKYGKVVEWETYPQHDYAVRDYTEESESKPDFELFEYEPDSEVSERESDSKTSEVNPDSDFFEYKPREATSSSNHAESVESDPTSETSEYEPSEDTSSSSDS